METVVTLDLLEQFAIKNALEVYQGNKTQAAKALGISVRTIRNKITQYGFTQYKGQFQHNQGRPKKIWGTE